MRYLVAAIFVFPLLMFARENPFAPLQNSNMPPEKAAEAPTQTEKTVLQPKIHPQHDLNDKEVINYAKARFVFRENSVYIETKDEIIKHYSISNPPSIVIDFKSPSDFASKRDELATKPFLKLEMGAHDDRYRVVLRLDAVHNYSIEKRKYGQMVTIGD